MADGSISSKYSNAAIPENAGWIPQSNCRIKNQFFKQITRQFNTKLTKKKKAKVRILRIVPRRSFLCRTWRRTIGPLRSRPQRSDGELISFSRRCRLPPLQRGSLTRDWGRHGHGAEVDRWNPRKIWGILIQDRKGRRWLGFYRREWQFLKP